VTEPRKLAAELKEGAPRRAPQRLNGERKPTIEASSHRGTPQHWRPAYGALRAWRSLERFGAAHRPISGDVKLYYRVRLILSCEAGMKQRRS